MKGLAQLAVELDFLVEEYAGSRGRFPPIKHRRRCLYIATIEKAHSLVNNLLEQDRLDSLGLVVVDEVKDILKYVPENLLWVIMSMCTLPTNSPSHYIRMSPLLFSFIY